jgi:hypothetical protein
VLGWEGEGYCRIGVRWMIVASEEGGDKRLPCWETYYHVSCKNSETDTILSVSERYSVVKRLYIHLIQYSIMYR